MADNGAPAAGPHQTSSNGAGDPAGSHQAHHAITQEKPAEEGATQASVAQQIPDAGPIEKATHTIPSEASAAAGAPVHEQSVAAQSGTDGNAVRDAPVQSVEDHRETTDTDIVDATDDGVSAQVSTADRIPMYSWGSDSQPAPPSVDSDDTSVSTGLWLLVVPYDLAG
jgi:hypothetical protein